jgi:hypothetical protein
MTPQRRAYILEHLGKNTPGDNWIRIPTAEFDEFGGREFFQGCMVEYMRDGKYFTTRVGQRGWTKEERIQLPWKIHAPRGGWKPNGGWAQYGEILVDPALDPQIANEIVNAINGTDITMEHHVNRQTLVAVVKEAKDEYETLYNSFLMLYSSKLRDRVEAHLDGANVNHLSLGLSDAEGGIGILPDLSDQFDNLIQMLEMDVRKVLELTEDEYQQFVDHRWDNTKMLKQTIGRLERLA